MDPSQASKPSSDSDLKSESYKMLDESKQIALRAALGSDEILLVQGPPGTGKTQLIVALILEELARNENARILLSSQTHIAIDNALERLGKSLPKGRILRIARDSSGHVQESAEPYLIERQMKDWKAEVTINAARGLEEWAGGQGLDPLDIRMGSAVRQIVLLKNRVEHTRKLVQDEEGRKRGIEKMKSMLATTVWDIEMETVREGLHELREKLDSDKKQLSMQEDLLKGMSKDGTSLVQLPAEDQLQWASVLLGESEKERAAEQLIEIQSEWIDRFGASRGFIRPLIERSSVVASTCLGLAAIAEMDEVELDLCIIDEASKASAMETCVPISRCKRWILVGDSKQLPPFREEILARSDLRERYDIFSEEASESIFERFRRLLPSECETTLKTQYRMVLPIGRLVSECFYEGQLESVRTNVDPVLCSVTDRVACWISTRELPQRQERKANTSFVNTEEASIVSGLLFGLDAGIAASKTAQSRSVIVLSGYSAQVNHLEQRLRNVRPNLRHLQVECCTIDRVQGREADVVVFSVTRSNPAHDAGFLRTLERINVALSRARDLLVIIGDDGFVEQAQDAEPLRRVLRHIHAWPSECAILSGTAFSGRGGVQ